MARAPQPHAPVDPLEDPLEHEGWRRVPAYADVSAEQFASHRWQSTHGVRSLEQLRATLGGLVSPAFLDDVAAGMAVAPMAVRLTPHVLALVDWRDPVHDPIRRQFLPLGSEAEPDHPAACDDPLAESLHSPIPGLVHRYRDRALLLAVDTCPVYCRFCTRAYAVGPDTPRPSRVKLDLGLPDLEPRLAYIAGHPELEDIVISGGDAYNLPAARLAALGRRLLDVPHVRRLRVATKGPAVLPQRLLGDDPWLAALLEVVERGRARGKSVVVHTHFNHPRELTALALRALARLTEAGVTTRNQSVLLRGVNDELATLEALVRGLARASVEPYYVFLSDMVVGLEGLRTPLHVAVALEKQLRGRVPGFDMPAFVVDTAGGGGKRHVHAHEVYDRRHGVALYRAPAIDPARAYFHFDPLGSLPAEGRRRWSDPRERSAILAEAAEAAETAETAEAAETAETAETAEAAARG